MNMSKLYGQVMCMYFLEPETKLVLN